MDMLQWRSWAARISAVLHTPWPVVLTMYVDDALRLWPEVQTIYAETWARRAP